MNHQSFFQFSDANIKPEEKKILNKFTTCTSAEKMKEIHILKQEERTKICFIQFGFNW